VHERAGIAIEEIRRPAVRRRGVVEWGADEDQRPRDRDRDPT